ncbi:DUF3027 domain-containing protein [uncultured Microbacterium sp.]|uniref:DUF3027 domain-containing protein n=1 Tax=uncultured Microbacterium sp. TaxID=191216 RepID=UPI0028DBC431|nr:DUF3027 domain-containing protein [uncultured Microbacterium sp.]
MTSKPEPDERLVGAHDLALQALREITPASTIGPAAGYFVEDDGTVSLRFENRLAGYPGWYWIVTVARVDDDEPTVLEAELLPGDGSLLAPEWVPWAERLAEYRAHQAELAEQSAAAAADDSGSDAEDGTEDDESDDLDDETDDVEDDLDLDDEEDDEDDEIDGVVSPRLHAGDLDGVDIDELDDSVESDEDDDADDDEADDVETDDDDVESDADDEDETDDVADDSAAEGDDSEEE